MPKQLNRYQNNEIIEHLASQYVLGLLPPKVRARTERLLLNNERLAGQVNFWQKRFTCLDKQTEELAPKAQTWQAIAAQITPSEQTTNRDHSTAKNTLGSWLSSAFTPFSALAATLVIVFFSYFILVPQHPSDPLSYVAVLTDKNQQAQLVASTYGESKKLVLNVINTPAINADQDLEVWVIFKTDQQASSLGVIPRHKKLIEKQLTTPQWRLIKDSDSLIVTIEDSGGSPIGEPSELIVSRGLFVHLKEGEKSLIY